MNINSVIGGGIKNPEDAEVITNRALELGFASSLGIIHDGSGSVKPLNRREERVYREIKTVRESRATAAFTGFRKIWRAENPTTGNAAQAPATCTSAKTVWSTTVRSSAAIPEFRSRSTPSPMSSASTSTKKSCAPHCTVGCVQKISVIDHWRDPQMTEPAVGRTDSVRGHSLGSVGEFTRRECGIRHRRKSLRRKFHATAD